MNLFGAEAMALKWIQSVWNWIYVGCDDIKDICLEKELKVLCFLLLTFTKRIIWDWK